LTLKLLHTADWHIGHRLHGFDRTFEHRNFLDWLLAEIETRSVDGLLVCGDIFDTANPSATSWQLFYQFLATLRQRFPALNVVIIGGNHDSPSKLDAPHDLLKSFNLHLIGSVERDESGLLLTEKLVVPLKNASGETLAWCAAVPFLRSADLRTRDEEMGDKLINGVQGVYQEVFDTINTLRKPNQPIIAIGHAYLREGELSALSERKVLGGNQHALPLSVFDGANHVALGHLHLSQQLGDQVWYSGSPLPLSMSEQHYPHQVIELTVDDGTISVSDRIRVPHTVDMLRIPAKAAPLDEVLGALDALDLPERAFHERPYIEVNVLLEKPQARLREKITAALVDKPVRLTRIHTEYTGHGLGVADRFSGEALDMLTPKDVFTLCYQRHYHHTPDAALIACFESLEDEMENQEA